MRLTGVGKKWSVALFPRAFSISLLLSSRLLNSTCKSTDGTARYCINDFQGALNKACQLFDVEHLGGASRIITAEIVARVIVDVVEFIEQSASGMLLTSIADFLDNAR